MNELIEDLIYGAEKRKNALLAVVIDLFAESGKIDDGDENLPNCIRLNAIRNASLRALTSQNILHGGSVGLT